jgi:putative ABC transport system permease protein
MLYLTLSLRHMFRHWRLNIPILLVMVMGSAFASGLPMLASMIAGGALSQSLLDATVPKRNLEIRGEGLSGEHDELLQSTLGDWIQQRMEIREVTQEAERTIHSAAGEETSISGILYLSFWSFDKLDDLTDVVAGRMPSDSVWDEPSKGRLLEVAVGAEAATRMDLNLGDEIKFYEELITVRVVGILSPKDPTADVWWGDDLLLPFNIRKETGLSQTDTIFISLLVSPEMMQAELPSHKMYRRFLLDLDAIDVQNADVMCENLVKLETNLNSLGSKLVTGLVELIKEYQVQRGLAQISLLLLTVQSIIAVLYTLAMVSSYLLDQSQGEVIALAGRGYSSWQITRIFAIEMAVLAFVLALPAGPFVAYGAFRFWSFLTGHMVLKGIPPESWALSAGVLLIGCLTLVIPLVLRTRRTLSEWYSEVGRPPESPWWQRLIFDIILLALGGFAYWQLTQTGGFIRSLGEASESFLGAADPVLLLGPTLLILAVALLAIRLFPILLQVLAKGSQSSSGLALPLGLSQLARAPSGPVRVAILISLTVGLAFFAVVFERSIEDRQVEVAHYLAGADLRVVQSLSRSKADQDRDSITALPGIQATSQAYRTRSRWGEGSGIVVDFLAVEPSTMGKVSTFPPGLSSVSMEAILKVLEPSEKDVIPIVLSYDAPPRDKQIGDQVQYRVGQQKYEFEVRGIIVNYPTLDNPFVITNLPALEQVIDLNSSALALIGTRELWLAVQPSFHEAVVETLQDQAKEEVGLASFQASRIADDAQARLKTFQGDLAAKTANVAFRLNAITLGILSVGGFALVQIFAAVRRRRQFSVLRAIGFSTAQFAGVIFLEGLMLLILGILLGFGIGYGLAYLMKPFLSLTLQASLGGAAIDQLIVPWSTIGGTLLVLAGLDILALVVLLVGLLRSKTHQTLRVSEE